MTFDDLWDEIKKQKALPNTAIFQIPSIISDDTKKNSKRSEQRILLGLSGRHSMKSTTGAFKQ